ncbi:hypothetical protein [Streptococcus merionis]|uniref:hypothetical protein n=1 Tax=Streptococcus merionis TaxID=400065 RepID=UPI003513B403
MTYFITFGTICKIILKNGKQTKLVHDWNKQVDVVNSLLSLVGVKHYYDPGACSSFVNEKKEIPRALRLKLLQHPHDELLHTVSNKISPLSETLSLKNLSYNLHSILDNVKSDSLKPYHYDNSTPYVVSFQELDELLSSEAYAIYLGKLLLYSLIMIPNIRTEVDESQQELSLSFDKTLEGYIQKGTYFEHFHREIIIIPLPEKAHYRVVNHTSYSSPRISPQTLKHEGFYYFFSFSNREEQEAHELEQLIINDIDFTDTVTYTLAYEAEREYPFVKRYATKNIPEANFYTVSVYFSSQRAFPVIHNSFCLSIPCKDFKTTFELRHYENYKYRSTFKPLGNFHPQAANIDRTPPNASLSYFHNIGWTFPRAGYYYVVEPQPPFWPEILAYNHDIIKLSHFDLDNRANTEN